MLAKHLLIEGRVQGVCFRANTQRAAQQLDLVGWVKNLPDGRVEAFAQGDEESLDQLITWCHNGPAWARVLAVIAQNVDCDDTLTSFEVRY